MIHQPLGGFQGQASDIDIHAKEILLVRESKLFLVQQCLPSGENDGVQCKNERDTIVFTITINKVLFAV